MRIRKHKPACSRAYHFGLLVCAPYPCCFVFPGLPSDLLAAISFRQPSPEWQRSTSNFILELNARSSAMLASCWTGLTLIFAAISGPALQQAAAAAHSWHAELLADKRGLACDRDKSHAASPLNRATRRPNGAANPSRSSARSSH